MNIYIYIYTFFVTGFVNPLIRMPPRSARLEEGAIPVLPKLLVFTASNPSTHRYFVPSRPFTSSKSALRNDNPSYYNHLLLFKTCKEP